MLLVEPETLKVYEVGFNGKKMGLYEVTGKNGDKYVCVGLFHSEAAAKNFATWSFQHQKTWAGSEVSPEDYLPEPLLDTSLESQTPTA